MATANKLYHPQIPAPPPELRAVVLEVTPREAEVIMLALGRLNGDAHEVTAVYQVLKHVGVDPDVAPFRYDSAGQCGIWTVVLDT